MKEIGGYIFSVACGAILCGILKNLSLKQGTSSAMVKFLTGVFMAVTVFSPLVELEIGNLPEVLFPDGQTVPAVQTGQDFSYDRLHSIIKDETEAYILDKAEKLALNVQVEVKLSDSDIPVPYQVTIQGSASPYAKSTLMRYITEELDIPRERLVWN